MISLESKRIFPLLNNQTLVLLYTCIKYLSEEEKDREEGGQELRGRVEGRSKGGGGTMPQGSHRRVPSLAVAEAAFSLACLSLPNGR